MFRIITSPRTLVVLAFDCLCAVMAWQIAHFVRYTLEGGQIPSIAVSMLPLVIAAEAACFLVFGLYRGFWRFSSLRDLRRIFFSVVAAAMLIPLVAWLAFGPPPPPPRSIYLINPLLLFTMMALGRIIYRWWREERPFAGTRNLGDPVLLLLTDNSNLSLIESFDQSSRWRLVGLLDQNGRLSGRRVHGQPVLGTWQELSSIAERLGVSHALLADAGLHHELRRKVFELCEQANLKLMLAPALDSVMNGQIKIADIREVELDDLLGRDPIDLDLPGISRLLQGRTVLVTGAGGSIGSELCRQIAAFGPSRIVLIETSEYSLYQMDQEFRGRFPGIIIESWICDVKDTDRLVEILQATRPYLVFHAAAYKHVPLMEVDNAWQCVRNNAFGTLSLLYALEACPVEKLIVISTDKAVNPTNVMGASKRLAEQLVQIWTKKTGIPAMMVRFGNVLGSTGSVVPLFKQQIAMGGPVTVTHPDIRRYFMSIPEAVKLVLQCSNMGRSGEIFVLDMGEPVRIVDLARDLIHLSGFTEDQIKIEYTGLRPGEKLYEELLADHETTLETRHSKIRISRSQALPDDVWWNSAIEMLSQTRPLSDALTKDMLRRFVPEYAHMTKAGQSAHSDTQVLIAAKA